MAGSQRDTDFAVRLEAADARAVPGARIDHHERSPFRIDLDAGRRDDAGQRVVDRPLQPPTVDQEFHLVIEHVRNRVSEMLAILVAALAQHIPEQHAALSRIDHVFGRGLRHAKRCRRGTIGLRGHRTYSEPRLGNHADFGACFFDPNQWMTERTRQSNGGPPLYPHQYPKNNQETGRSSPSPGAAPRRSGLSVPSLRSPISTTRRGNTSNRWLARWGRRSSCRST